MDTKKCEKENNISEGGDSPNREYKDSLFCYLFGNEKHPEYTLALYNAVNGTDYTNPDDVTITTLKDVLYINVRNDLSFLISGKMNFYEHQSTYNPNMPVRMLMYAGKVFNRYIKENKLDVYSSTKLKLPLPKCICFYNGTANRKDKSVMKFSDLYDVDENSDIEIKVTMYNINHGHNKKLINACRPLKEYAEFVENVRRYSKTEKLEDAIESAVNALPDDSEIKGLLTDNLSEVKTMCITEYTQENADMLREIETQRRIDEEKKRTEKEKERADEAEKRADEAAENLIFKDNVIQEQNNLIKKKDNELQEQREEIAFLKAQLAAKNS